MNRLKNKWIVAITVCAVVILGGVMFAMLSQKLGFSAAYAKAGFLVSFIGAGGMGVVIARFVHSIPQQERFHRKRLEVKAWNDLGRYCYGLVVAAISIYLLMKKGDDERNFAMMFAAVIIGIWIPVRQLIMKKRNLRGLDERERLIHERAKAISDSFFASFCMMGLLGLWGWVGLKSSVPVYIPVIIVFGLGAIAEILKPLLILIQCKMEQLNE